MKMKNFIEKKNEEKIEEKWMRKHNVKMNEGKLIIKKKMKINLRLDGFIPCFF